MAEEILLFGLARMWEMLMVSTGWEIMVFKTRKEAEAWLRKGVSAKCGQDDLNFCSAPNQTCLGRG